MDVIERCPACGAQLAPDVDWCGQCYARISRNEGVVRVMAASPPPPEEVESKAPPPEASASGSPATAFDFVESVGRRAAAASVSSTPVSTIPVSTLAPHPVAGMVAAAPPIDPSGTEDAALVAALSASAGPAQSFGPGARKWASALVVLLAVATDLLFFPYTKFMALYGVLAAALSGYVVQRLWPRGSGRRTVQ